MRSRLARSGAWCAVLAITLLLPGIVHAAGTLERTDSFQAAFRFSFQLDSCGEQKLGAIFRRALLEDFGHCPFSDAARARFRHWVDSETKDQTGRLQRYVAQHGALPDRLDGMNETCSEYRASSDYQHARSLLEDYDRGAVTVDKVITDACDAGTGGP